MINGVYNLNFEMWGGGGTGLTVQEVVQVVLFKMFSSHGSKFHVGGGGAGYSGGQTMDTIK